MKKFLLLILTGLLMITLVSCGQTNKPNINDDPGTTEKPGDDDPGTTEKPDNNKPDSGENNDTKVSYGTDGAKYLLAQSRLNESVLNDSSNIFDGEEVLTNLANKIKLSTRRSKRTPHQLSLDTVSITDTTVEWDANQKDYSNSMSYFLNLSGNVANSATYGAEMISYVKKNIRVIGVWVDVDETSSYLLEVDENSETIYHKINNQTYVCRRYTNDDGLDVYETYYINDIAQTRMKYIENLLIEYFHKDNTSDFEHHFMADFYKGYWDVFGYLDEENYTATIIKDSIVYDYISYYGKTHPAILDIVSSDRKNDVISISGLNDITIYPTAFRGIDKLTVDIDSKDDIGDINGPDGDSKKVQILDGTYNVFGSADVNIVLDNGNVLKPGKITDKVTYNRTFISYQFGDNTYFNQTGLYVKGDTIDEVLNNLKDFLAENGITCRYDFDSIIEDTIAAQEEIASNSLYKKWNGVVINSTENIKESVEIELAKYDFYKELISKANEIKHINVNDQEELYNNIAFAEIVNSAKDKISFDGKKITVNNLSLTVDDTRLLDKLETYMISFGLVKKNNNSVVTIETTIEENPYDNSETYTLDFTGELILPNLDFGDYIPVFYLSTSDGIRLSAVEPLVFDEVVEVNYKDENHIITISKTEDNYLYMSIERNLEIYLNYKFTEVANYDDLLLLLGSTANEYGIISSEDIIEILNVETNEYNEFLKDSEVITGKYRIKYKVYIDEEYHESYLFLDLVVEIPVEEPIEGENADTPAAEEKPTEGENTDIPVEEEKPTEGENTDIPVEEKEEVEGENTESTEATVQ